MPNFRLSPRELDQVVTAVLGFQQLNAAPRSSSELVAVEVAIERGRRIVKDNNCQGCHVIEGFGGSFRSLVADASLAPPIIQGEGAKVQSDWLFGFLAAPKTGEIRPWLEVHMPTFGFTDAELNDLTHYFASLDRASYPFLVAGNATNPATWAAGKKMFELLRCAQCHPALARGLQPARRRPRDPRPEPPDGLDAPATRLDSRTGSGGPTNGCRERACRPTSPRATTGTASHRSVGTLDAPSFAADRVEFARILGGDDAAKAVPVAAPKP